MGNVGTTDADAAFVGRNEPGNRAEQRRLAATGASQKRDHLAARDLEAHAVEHP